MFESKRPPSTALQTKFLCTAGRSQFAAPTAAAANCLWTPNAAFEVCARAVAACFAPRHCSVHSFDSTYAISTALAGVFLLQGYGQPAGLRTLLEATRRSRELEHHSRVHSMRHPGAACRLGGAACAILVWPVPSAWHSRVDAECTQGSARADTALHGANVPLHRRPPIRTCRRTCSRQTQLPSR